MKEAVVPQDLVELAEGPGALGVEAHLRENNVVSLPECPSSHFIIDDPTWMTGRFFDKYLMKTIKAHANLAHLLEGGGGADVPTGDGAGGGGPGGGGASR